MTPIADSGARREFATGAVRDCAVGKGRMDLLPMRALMEVSGLYEAGARKYTRKIAVWPRDVPLFLERECSCGNTTRLPCATPTDGTPQEGCASSATEPPTLKPNGLRAIQTDLHTWPGYVASATTDSLSQPIQSTPVASAPISAVGSTTRITQPGKPPETRSTRSSQYPNSSRRDASERPLLQRSGLHQTMNCGCLMPRVACAQSAVAHQEGDSSNSITTTQPAKCEGCCADDATRHSDCLETIETLLREHSPTCHIRQRNSYKALPDGSVEISETGDRNWEKGISTHCYADSAMRHLSKFLIGESDECHLTAAAWNVLCLIDTLLRIRDGILPTEIHDLPFPLESIPMFTPAP